MIVIDKRLLAITCERAFSLKCQLVAVGWAKRSVPTKTFRHNRLGFWRWARRKGAFCPPYYSTTGLRHHPISPNRLAPIYSASTAAFDTLRLLISPGMSSRATMLQVSRVS
jgi:hypothetical protein